MFDLVRRGRFISRPSDDGARFRREPSPLSRGFFFFIYTFSRRAHAPSRLVSSVPCRQNLALNVAEKGFKISVYNRSPDKTDNAVARAEKEGLGANFSGYKDMKAFVHSIQKPRCVIILVKAGAPVDATIAGLAEHMEPGDVIIDGGNEWYENTERRQHLLTITITIIITITITTITITIT